MKKNNIGYLLREGVRGVFVNGFMSFAAVCVTVACLIIMGSFLLILFNLNEMIVDLEQENEMLVYIDESYSEAKAKSVGSQLNLISNIREAKYVSRDEALDSFVEEMDSDAMFNGLDASTFRDRYVVTLEDNSLMKETEAQIRATLPDAHLLLIPRTLENLVKNGRAPKLAGQLTQMLNIRLAVSPEWKSGEIKAIKKGRGAKRIVVNTMADCLAFLAEHPGSSVRVLTTGAAEEQELVSQALAGQDYVDAGTGPIGCTIATHVGIDAIAISYCPRYQPIH